MPLDERLREGLRREAETIQPDVGGGLRAVEARARRQGTMGLGSLIGAAAVVLLVVAFQAVRSVPDDEIGGSRGSPSPTAMTPDASGYDHLSGTYVVILQAGDASESADDVAGGWSMTLDGDGTMLVAPPSTFEEGGAVQSGVAFSIDRDRLRTNLFQERCDSVGEYRWDLTDDRLTLTPVAEDCALRRTVLSARAWERQ
jgi:hypothetical protein